MSRYLSRHDVQRCISYTKQQLAQATLLSSEWPPCSLSRNDLLKHTNVCFLSRRLIGAAVLLKSMRKTAWYASEWAPFSLSRNDFLKHTNVCFLSRRLSGAPVPRESMRKTSQPSSASATCLQSKKQWASIIDGDIFHYAVEKNLVRKFR